MARSEALKSLQRDWRMLRVEPVDSWSIYLTPDDGVAVALESATDDEGIDARALVTAYGTSQRKMACAAKLLQSGDVSKKQAKSCVSELSWTPRKPHHG